MPPNHQDSNYRMARESFLDRVPIPGDQVHRMRGEASPQSAAEEYEGLLRQVLQGPTPSFDLILLGIGEDGHTAFLFSNTDALGEKERLVVANWAPYLQAHRITFTLPLINAARAVAFLVMEESKAQVLRQVLKPAPRRAVASLLAGTPCIRHRPLVSHHRSGQPALGGPAKGP